jgi:hypothetical protein
MANGRFDSSVWAAGGALYFGSDCIAVHFGQLSWENEEAGETVAG